MRAFSLTIFSVLICLGIYADTPQKIGYQAIVRDSTGVLIQNQNIDVRVSILIGNSAGSVAYYEEHTPSTNGNGLLSFEIGDGFNTTGSIGQIDWSGDNYFIKVETDIYGQGTYDIIATSELISVPYALHAETADSLIGGEVDPTFSQSPASSLSQTDISNIQQITNYNGLSNDTAIVIPRIAIKGQTLSVTFSTGNTNFQQATQASGTSVQLVFQQGTSTSIINSIAAHWFNSKRVDAVFSIPWYAASGTYDVIVNPNASQPTWLDKFFEIF